MNINTMIMLVVVKLPGGAQSSSSPGGTQSSLRVTGPVGGRGISELGVGMSAMFMSTPPGSPGSGILSVSDGCAVDIPKVDRGTPMLASLAVRFFCMCCWAAAIMADMSMGWGRGFLDGLGGGFSGTGAGAGAISGGGTEAA